MTALLLVVWALQLNAANYATDYPLPQNRCYAEVGAVLQHAQRTWRVTILDGREVLARARINRKLEPRWTRKPDVLHPDTTAFTDCSGGINLNIREPVIR